MAEALEDILSVTKRDRRLLSHVPDSTGGRTNTDRRNTGSAVLRQQDFEEYIATEMAGQRYEVEYPVLVRYRGKGEQQESTMQGVCLDISTTGMLLRLNEGVDGTSLLTAEGLTLTFEITSGSMPEGYEMKVKGLTAECIRCFHKEGESRGFCGIRFKESLSEYVNMRQGRYMLWAASFFLFVVALVIILMRTESVIYFRFNRWLYLYSIIAAVFLLSRYLFGAFYRPVPIDPNYTPGVTVIIPCFNEEQWIQRTIQSCMDQDYPQEKLEVIVIDDCSNDRSVEKIKEIIEELRLQGARYHVEERLSYYVQPQNAGKRDALAVGAKRAKFDLLVFVDSDSFVDPFAIRNIVQPFKDEEMGGVSGRTDVANTYTNALTKMQSVRYYIAFRIMKAAEGYFDAATCLSGPLSCYRKDLVLKYCDDWLNQTFLGKRATFGDDRSMTNFILRHNRTGYQDTAICSTIVPNTNKMFLKQQMRWKRSWLRESLIAGRFMWKKEPFMALFFYMGLMVPIFAPIIVLYNLIYVPLMNRVFPLPFIVGMLLMAALMSMAQLFLRKSSTWIYGIWFCLYYEFILLWQMPVAWFTFWHSTWGTRATPADLEEMRKKEEKRLRREEQKRQKTRAKEEAV